VVETRGTKIGATKSLFCQTSVLPTTEKSVCHRIMKQSIVPTLVLTLVETSKVWVFFQTVSSVIRGDRIYIWDTKKYFGFNTLKTARKVEHLTDPIKYLSWINNNKNSCINNKTSKSYEIAIHVTIWTCTINITV
jgi:hypothetical protein